MTDTPQDIVDKMNHPSAEGIISKTKLGYIFIIQGNHLTTVPLLSDEDNVDKMYVTMKEYIPNNTILRLGFYEEIPAKLEEVTLKHEKRVYVKHRSEVREYIRQVWEILNRHEENT